MCGHPTPCDKKGRISKQLHVAEIKMASANHPAVTGSESLSPMTNDPIEEPNWMWGTICSSLKYFAKVGADLAVWCPEMTVALKGVEKVQDDIKDDVENMDLPYEIQVEMMELRNELKECIRIAKAFLFPCVNMANFCLDPEVIDAIDNELPAEVKSLLSFIDCFKKEFDICCDKLDKFEQQKNKLHEIAMKFMQKYVQNEKDGEIQLKTAQQEHVAHSLDSRASLVNKLSKLALAETAKGNMPADTAASVTAIFAIANVFAYQHEYKRVKNMATDKQNIKECTMSVATAGQAQKAINNFVTTSNEVRTFVYDIWNHAEIVDTHGKSLKDETDSIPFDIVKHRYVKKKLESIRQSMGKIVQTLGVEGQHIDSALLINAQPQQAASEPFQLEGKTTLKLPSKETIGSKQNDKASIQVQSSINTQSQVLVPNKPYSRKPNSI